MNVESPPRLHELLHEIRDSRETLPDSPLEGNPLPVKDLGGSTEKSPPALPGRWEARWRFFWGSPRNRSPVEDYPPTGSPGGFPGSPGSREEAREERSWTG